MSKIISYNTESRDKLKSGVDQLANAVKVTLGPKGRNVVIEKKIRCASYHKGWCHGGKKNRARRSNRKHGCTDGQRSCI